MAAHHVITIAFVFALLLSLTSVDALSTKENMKIPRKMGLSSSVNMMHRLKLYQDSVNCWGSLLALQSCTGEVITFFYEGEAYLGPACCKSIEIIEHHCWPSMMTTLGFTTEEGNILRGYCDKTEAKNLQNNGN